MKAEIVAIGTEILLGEIVDTNSAWIAQQLPALGIDLNHTSVVGDNMGRVMDTLGRAWERSDLVITTGGLGPTEDDMTREAISRLLGEEPYVVPELEERLRGFFARRGIDMPESNIKQAWLIPSARAIDNPRGTAPGWWTERDGHVIVSMPGVPPEMERMWNHEVAPELEGRSGAVLVTRTLKTAGIGEGTVDEMARPVFDMPGIGVGTYARADGVHLRIGAKAATREEAQRLIEPAERELDAIFGNAIWGRDEDTLEGFIARTLGAREQTVGTLESTTGGLLASTLSDAPDAGGSFAGGLVSSGGSEEFAAVSAETAEGMAAAARERLGSDYGVGISAALGPDATVEQPGTFFVAVTGPGGTRSMKMVMAQGRGATKRRAITTALMLLRSSMLEEE
ncbi:MAG: CinA family nicotinamide mononucleotide deamidase-related protein [Chloroflexi bacterium]|nr:CinA family nicotinamide mononucleotide deamidase-related protein [Chloroflexota bacterium]